jgi:uncharacterized protein YcfJ
MSTIRKTIFMALLVTLATTGLASTSMAQYSSSNSTTTRELVRSIQTRTDTLRNDVQNASERNNYRFDDLNRLITDFSLATDQLDRRLATRRATATDARLVLDRAVLIDNFFVNNRVGAGSKRDWQPLRSDLDELARIYNLSTRWGSSTGGYGGNDYNLSDIQLRQLIQRIDTRTTTFSRALRLDLNRNLAYGGYSREQVRQQLSVFETAVASARNRATSRQLTTADVRNLLEPAASINNFVIAQRLSYQTENGWSALKPDLDSLASAFNIAADWSTTPGGSTETNAGLTGTYRINSSQGDNARNAVDAATRNLSLAERQRVYDVLLRRLDPPQMLAIDRRGNSVTIASTRAPQINFVADGREQVETAANGRTVRVRASFSGDTLNVVRSGDRTNDFTVTFDPTQYGRSLMVTRTLYSDRLTQPVTVRTSYDRVSDVAQLNIYEANRENADTATSDNFLIPNGTEVVAVLNTNLSTENVGEGQPFTMTVRSPGQYAGATIEGRVSSFNRSGRITGRADMTLDFDNIRMRDGRVYRFAGILESVRTTNGDVVRVDNEGAVRDNDQTNKTVTRTAIGSAVGALIGAIAGGGKGAAIGAAIGAGAGAGSVYIQGRNDLELNSGTEITVRATGPRN